MLSIYYVPDAVLKTHSLSLLSFTTSKDRCYYYPYFKDEKNEFYKLYDLQVRNTVVSAEITSDSRAHIFPSTCYHYNDKKIK